MSQNYFQNCILKIKEKKQLNFKVTKQELSEAKKIINPLRKLSFLTGRHYAHLLLQSYNISLQTLTAKKNGAIIWQAGIKGSISHSKKKIALCVSQSKKIISIGIDLERIDRNPSIKIYQKIKHPDENFQNPTQLDTLKIFCVKEAIIKCFGQLEQKILFQDICILKLNPCLFSLANENIFFQKAYLAQKGNHLLASFILKIL